jgi:hypothetical protein
MCPECHIQALKAWRHYAECSHAESLGAGLATISENNGRIFLKLSGHTVPLPLFSPRFICSHIFSN